MDRNKKHNNRQRFYSLYKPNSDKIAKQTRNILSFSSMPPLARETRLLEIAALKFDGESIKALRINFIASILSTSFFNAKSIDLKIIFFEEYRSFKIFVYLAISTGINRLLKCPTSSSVFKTCLIALKPPERIAVASCTKHTRRLRGKNYQYIIINTTNNYSKLTNTALLPPNNHVQQNFH